MATYRHIWGARIKAARIAAGLTKTQVADAMGVDQSVPGRWEQGIMIPRDELRPALATLLGVNVDTLFRHTNGDDQPETVSVA